MIKLQAPFVIIHFLEKAHFKKMKEGEKKYKKCFNGKTLITFLIDNYKIEKEESKNMCQEILNEGYISEIKKNTQIYNNDSTYNLNTDIKEIFMNSKKLYKDLTIMMMDENLFLIDLFLQLYEKVGSKALLKLLANYMESKNLTYKFLKRFCSSQGNYFREDTIDGKILIEIFKIYGNQYLHNQLKEFISYVQHSPKSFELDFEKPEFEFFFESNVLTTKKFLTKLLDKILNSKESIPLKIIEILHFIREGIGSKMDPQNKSKEYIRRFVGILFFLRYITPTIVFPEELIKDIHINLQERKAFLGISKLFQIVINGTILEEENKLSFLNTITQNYQEKINNFCLEISTKKEIETTTKTTLKEENTEKNKKKSKLEMLLGQESTEDGGLKNSNTVNHELDINKNLLSISHILSQITDIILKNASDLRDIFFRFHPNVENQTNSTQLFLNYIDIFVRFQEMEYSPPEPLSPKNLSDLSDSSTSPSVSPRFFTLKVPKKEKIRKSFPIQQNMNIY